MPVAIETARFVVTFLGATTLTVKLEDPPAGTATCMRGTPLTVVFFTLPALPASVTGCLLKSASVVRPLPEGRVTGPVGSAVLTRGGDAPELEPAVLVGVVEVEELEAVVLVDDAIVLAALVNDAVVLVSDAAVLVVLVDGAATATHLPFVVSQDPLAQLTAL